MGRVPGAEKIASTTFELAFHFTGQNRLILALRLFHLCRLIDLAQMWRTLSSTSSASKEFNKDGLFVLLKRKGAHAASWEQVLRLPVRDISPLDLMLQYVHLTSHLPPGSLLFVSLRPPFAPLTANSIGRVTKHALEKLGVPISVFGPHSSRGAGVKMYKALGLSSEHVCELGKWKKKRGHFRLIT